MRIVERVGRSQSPVFSSSLCDLAPERIRLDEVRESALPVDLDDRKPLAVTRLEAGDAADVDLCELEAQLVSRRLHHAARGGAEVTAVGVVENDPGQSYG